MTDDLIIVKKANDIGKIIFNNGPLNILTINMMEQINEALEGFLEDESLKAVIFDHNGKAFSAGVDIGDHMGDKAPKMIKEFHGIFRKLNKIKCPIIASVKGAALGGGCELALACHIRFVSETAKFGQPEVNLGIIPGYGGTQRLTRLINSGRAIEYILTADMIDAEEALRIGLANRVYPQAELMDETKKMAKKISVKGQQAIRLAINAIKNVDQLNLSEGQNLEASLFALCCGTEDFKEGTFAFLEKRKPSFKNK